MSKNSFTQPIFFFKKLNILHISEHIIFLKFHQCVFQIRIKSVWRDFRLPKSALTTVARTTEEFFLSKFAGKNDFQIGNINVFYRTIADADIGSL